MANKGNSRAPWHDYRSKAKYMITLKKRSSAPSFGDITNVENAYTLLSRTGTNVKNSIGKIRLFCEDIRLWQYIVMPDHVHFLIYVENYLDEPLGNTIARLKVEINNLCGEPIFEQGFNDQIITPQRSLDTVFRYIKENPYRLAVRFAHPEYFRRVNELTIAEGKYQAYGNVSLLRNPFKEQVVCHRADTDLIKAKNSDRWLYTASNGGVLVSPFISPAEKKIREMAEELGAKLILITHEAFPERYKPTAHDFELCEQGRLLIISLGLPARTELSRAHCLAMNSLAEAIASQTDQ